MDRPLPSARAEPHGRYLQNPSWAHWLGTDQLGRDVWSRLLWAGRFDLATGFIVVLIPITIGTLIGTLAGYYKGWPDTVLSRIIDVVMAFPYYVLIITLVFAVGKGIQGIFIAFALTDWVTYARTVRSSTLVVGLRSRRAVAHPLAARRKDGLAGRNLLHAVAGFHLQLPAQHDGVLVELRRLSRLAPARRADHPRDADGGGFGVHAAKEFFDRFRRRADRLNTLGCFDNLGHGRCRG